MPNKLTDNEIQKLIYLVRETQFHYQLDKFSDASLKEIQKSVSQARREVSQKLATINPDSKFTKERLNDIAIEMQDMTVGIQAQITGQIEQTAVAAGAKAYPRHADIMSFGGLVPNFNNVALTGVQLKAIVNTPVGGKLLSEWVDTAFTANLKDTFKQEITTGLLKGESYKNLVKRFDNKAFAGLESDIQGLTRTYVQSINVKAMDDTMRANSDIIKSKKWNAVYENRSCTRCLSIDSKNEIYPLDGGPEMPLHVNCILGETPVFSPDMKAAFVATYTGPVIDIVLTDGRRVTATCNHMFLTPQGFVAAKSINKGDKIFDSTLGKGAGILDPNNNNRPSMIKDVISSFSKSFGIPTISVPPTAKDFHGDARFCDSNINIISPDGFLVDSGNIPFSKAINQIDFNRPDIRGFEFNTLSNFMSCLFALNDALHVEPIRAAFNPGKFKFLPNQSLGYIKGFRNRLLGFTSKIPFANFINRQIKCWLAPKRYFIPFQSSINRCKVCINGFSNILDFISRNISFAYFRIIKSWILPFCRNIIPSQYRGNKSSITADNLSNVRKAFPGQIEIADVLFVTKKHFSGHVYDLQSFSSLYTTNGLLSSNCRCFWEPITKTFRELGVDIDEVEDKFRAYSLRGTVDPITGKVTPGKIGLGNGRILESGRFLGDYNSFFKSLPENVQLQMLGPTRLGLYKSGKLSLAGLTDAAGNTKLLTELGMVRKGGKYVAAEVSIPKNWVVSPAVTKEFDILCQKYYNELPQKARDLLEESNSQIIIGSKVTDVFPELKGKHPRGWPAGSTWDSAEGLSRGNKIVVCENFRPIRAKKFVKTERTEILVKHESGHAIDTALNHFSESAEFGLAYRKDLAVLNNIDRGTYSYFIQKGRGYAGRSECFAQCVAEIAGDKSANMQHAFPSIYKLLKKVLKD